MDWMKEYGARLRDNGYSIIPIKPNSKAPGRFANGQWVNLSGWNQFADKPAQPFVISTWSRMPGCGIGVMCGKGAAQEYGVIAIDIDVLEPLVAAHVIEIFTRHLGETPAVRIGMAPKTLLLYRTAETFSKIAKGPIECLAYGQQFVAYGVHEKTGEPYQWPMESLVDTPIDRLPVITAAQIWAAIDEAYDILPAEMRVARLGAPTKTAEVISFSAHQANEDLRGTPEACRAFIDRIPNPNLIWDEWNRVGMALWSASGGQQWGWDLFDEFSRRSTKYNITTTTRRWTSYNKSQPNRIGLGTLQHISAQYDSSPISADIAFNEDKKAAADFDLSALIAEPLPPVPPPRAHGSATHMVQLTKSQVDSFPNEWLETSSLVGRITRWIVRQAVAEHPTLALANTLALMGAMFGRRYRANGESCLNTTCNIMTVGIAPSSSGKDHSRKMILKLMRAAGLSQFSGGEEFSSGPAIMEMMALFPSRLCMVDEFGLFLSSVRDPKAPTYRKTVMSMILKLYSSAGSAALGQEYANQKEAKRTDIEAPNFNVYGTSTPETFFEALSRAQVADGTLNRMLIFAALQAFPRTQVMKTGRTPGVPQDLVDDIKAAMSVLPAGAKSSTSLTPLQQPDAAPETIDVMFDAGVEDMLQGIADRETDLKNEGRIVYGRLFEYTIKLAMIEAIAMNPAAPIITEGALVMGYRLAEWCFEYLESIVSNDVAENEYEKRRNQFRKYIMAASDGATKTELAKRFKELRPKERDEILQSLVEEGEIVCGDLKTGGRPSKIYKSTRAA